MKTTNENIKIKTGEQVIEEKIRDAQKMIKRIGKQKFYQTISNKI